MAMNMNMAQGSGGMLKDGTTLADGVDEAILKNIGATKQLACIVKTSLGPNGMRKLVVNHLGKTLVTSDCATIARTPRVPTFRFGLFFVRGSRLLPPFETRALLL